MGKTGIALLGAALLLTAGCYVPMQQAGSRQSQPSPAEAALPSAPPVLPSPPALLPPLGLASDPVEVWLMTEHQVFYIPTLTLDLYFHGDRWYRKNGGEWYSAFDLRDTWSWVGTGDVPLPVFMAPTYRRQPHNYIPVPFGPWKESGYQVVPAIPPPIVLPSEPSELWQVPDSEVYYIPDIDIDLYFFAGTWYRPWGRGYYGAPDLSGPWEPILPPPGFRPPPRRPPRPPIRPAPPIVIPFPRPIRPVPTPVPPRPIPTLPPQPPVVRPEPVPPPQPPVLRPAPPPGPRPPVLRPEPPPGPRPPVLRPEPVVPAPEPPGHKKPPGRTIEPGPVPAPPSPAPVFSVAAPPAAAPPEPAPEQERRPRGREQRERGPGQE